MRISLIVAASENDIIGRDGGLPWHQSSDLKTFRRLTMGKPMIMGRRTFQSIGKPLDGRDNIVVTRDAGFEIPGVSVCDSVTDAITLARVLVKTGTGSREDEEIMIIGGAAIYDATIAIADRIYLTRIHATVDGDKTFRIPDDAGWTEVRREPLAKGPKDDFPSTLIVYERGAGAG